MTASAVVAAGWLRENLANAAVVDATSTFPISAATRAPNIATRTFPAPFISTSTMSPTRRRRRG